MNMIDAVRQVVRGKRAYGDASKAYDDYLATVASRLDQLTGHTKAVEACRAVIEADTRVTRASDCRLCSEFDASHDEFCPVRLCEAAVADAEKEKP